MAALRRNGRAWQPQGMVWLALILALGACAKTVDPQTGMADVRLTVPFTSANAQRAETQWRQCIQFRSESYCARNLPGGRPPSAGGPMPPEPGEVIQRENDP